MAPGGLMKDPISAISLGVALVFGSGGLPHVVMRFFAVADEDGDASSLAAASISDVATASAGRPVGRTVAQVGVPSLSVPMIVV